MTLAAFRALPKPAPPTSKADIDRMLTQSDDDLVQAVQRGVCTFKVTGAEFSPQPYWKCNTCGEGYGVCGKRVSTT
jgi:hypothetical protein